MADAAATGLEVGMGWRERERVLESKQQKRRGWWFGGYVGINAPSDGSAWEGGGNYKIQLKMIMSWEDMLV